jgi:hypothetical protein
MTVHSVHPDTHTHGLADDCERCAEHAEHPEESLDTDHFIELVMRVRSRQGARSENERKAMERIRIGLQVVDRLASERIGAKS